MVAFKSSENSKIYHKPLVFQLFHPIILEIFTEPNNNITDEAIINLARNLPNLKVLNIKRCSKISKEAKLQVTTLLPNLVISKEYGFYDITEDKIKADKALQGKEVIDNDVEGEDFKDEPSHKFRNIVTAASAVTAIGFGGLGVSMIAVPEVAAFLAFLLILSPWVVGAACISVALISAVIGLSVNADQVINCVGNAR